MKTHIPPEIKVGIKARIANGIAAPDDSKTLAVLEEAERWTKPYLHPADYFNRLPVDNHGIERDSSWVIPGTFIPTPIGGFVSVLGTGVAEISETEPKLQTLSNFLPGGFKHRWGFRLWYGRWQSVPDRPAFADATELTQDSEHLGTLEEILAGRPLPPPLKDFPPNSTLLINPRVLRVEAGQEHFHLTANRLRVKNSDDPPGGVALSREPSSTAQTFDLIVSNEDGTAIEIADTQMGVEGVTFGENKLLRLFYSNLVNCYPKSIGNVAQPPLSINVKFFDRLTNQRTIPAVAMRTQGIHLHGTILPKDVDKLLSACEGKTRNEHYWRLVYRLLWREAFLNRSLTSFRISFAFDCIKVVRTLRFLEFHCRLTNQGTDLGSLSVTDFERMFKQSSDVCEDLGLDIFNGSASVDALRQAANWQDLKDSVLLRAEDELRTAIAESYVKSLAMAVCRDVAELTNTNMDLIQTSLEIAPGSDDRIHFRTCVYDNLEGGGGTTLSYCERVKRRMHLIDISRNAMLCGTSRDESSILDILTDDKFNADSLYALVRSCHDLREFGLTEVASFKLRRLLSSPSITAFYQGVAEGYAKLRTVIDREPGEEELACFINLRPIADIRGNDLFMQFKRRRGGVSELIPRIAEIMRICHGSCPDCLGDSRLSFEKGEEVIADRNLLGEVAC